MTEMPLAAVPVATMAMPSASLASCSFLSSRRIVSGLVANTAAAVLTSSFSDRAGKAHWRLAETSRRQTSLFANVLADLRNVIWLTSSSLAIEREVEEMNGVRDPPSGIGGLLRSARLGEVFVCDREAALGCGLHDPNICRCRDAVPGVPGIDGRGLLPDFAGKLRPTGPIGYDLSSIHDPHYAQYAHQIKMRITLRENYAPAAHYARMKRPHAQIGSYPDRRAVAARLTLVREALAMSRAQMADHLNVARPSWTMFETAKRDLPLAVAWRIFTVHGFSPDFLYAGLLRGVPAEHLDTIRDALSAHNGL